MLAQGYPTFLKKVIMCASAKTGTICTVLLQSGCSALTGEIFYK